MPTKNAVASDSWPVVPTSSVSPMAPMAELIAKSPVCIQKASAYCGSHSSRAIRTPQAIRALDTGQLPRPEQPGGSPHQHDEQHHVRDDVRQPAAQERQVVLVAGRELLSDADHEPRDDGPGGRVQPSEHGYRDRAERQQAGHVAYAAGREADEERTADRRQRDPGSRARR